MVPHASVVNILAVKCIRKKEEEKYSYTVTLRYALIHKILHPYTSWPCVCQQIQHDEKCTRYT